MKPPAVEAINLRRTFKSRRSGLLSAKRSEPFEAVRGINFSIEAGEVFGLLGPNGAGKTTSIRMLSSLLLPTSGIAKVCGYDTTSQAREVRRRIGYIFGGDAGLYDRLSAKDNLRYFAQLASLDRSLEKRRIDELLELVGLNGRENDAVQTYSRGMRQRLHIARGLLAQPEVLFLDEPSIGVDPVAARDLRLLVQRLATEGTTILLTTHYMQEADELCNRIAVIAQGELQVLGTPTELKRHAEGLQIHVIEAYGADELHLTQLRNLASVSEVALEVEGTKQVLTVHSVPGENIQAQALEILRGIRIGRVESRSPSLEDAYVAIVSRERLVTSVGTR
ncbi:ABC transporter ATP-binding protein [Paenarthrobacter nicotinovorans]|uniref:ABC transporter ATP-binding protein n=1 Tax=Paenarthrobacter nicotinovorans TaxID=29320 RepID=UPI003D678141